MSETTSSPQPDDDQQEGTFVGGSFGFPDDSAREGSREDSPEQPTTAQQIEAEEEALAGAPAEPATTDEFITEPSGEDETGDVEGITAEPAPGDRNEPV